jgi:hypothetical protein
MWSLAVIKAMNAGASEPKPYGTRHRAEMAAKSKKAAAAKKGGKRNGNHAAKPLARAHN